MRYRKLDYGAKEEDGAAFDYFLEQFDLLQLPLKGGYQG